MRQPAVDAVYLDTSVVGTAMIPAIPHHQACDRFVAELVERETLVVFSYLLRLEFAQFWYQLPRSPYLDADTVRMFRLGAWDRNTGVRERWMAEGVSRFAVFPFRFRRVIEVPLDVPTWSAGVELMGRYRLRSQDALHAATALSAGIVNLASVDDDFRRVPNLRLHLLRDTPAAPTPAP